MILTTHAIVGAAAGRLVSNPLLAFTLGCISHFLIDAIPHWSYRLASIILDEKNPLKKDMIINRHSIKDLAIIAVDFCIGIILAIFIFQGKAGFTNFSLPLLAGIIGGVLPDALQFAYFKIKRRPLVDLQKLHIRFHLNHTKNIPALPYGILSQVAVVIAAIIISKLIF